MTGELTSFYLAGGTAAFAIGAVAYGVIAILVLFAHPGTRQADWLVAALVVSSLWCIAQIVLAWHSRALVAGLPVLDAVHIGAWLLFLASLLMGAMNSGLARTVGRLIVAAALTLFAVTLGQILLSGASLVLPAGGHVGLLPVLAMTLLGPLALEQIYRNADDDQGQFLKWLAAGIGAILVVATFDYSQAMLFQRLTPNLWVTSGIVNIAAAPLILVAIKRQPNWGQDLYVSHQLAFYTTALVGAGLYLFAMGIVGFILGTSDEAWGAPLQITFLALAGAVFVYGVFSADVRRWARIFVNRHFIRERYDYRDAWLGLSRALAAPDSSGTLAERGLLSLGEIIASPAGTLWIDGAGLARFERVASFGSPGDPADDLPTGDEMVRFLHHKQWVVDSREYLADPGKYGNAFAPDSAWIRRPAIVVPLINESRLVGIVRLDRPALLGDLNFKDHDLLKTAGQQVAVFLMQQRTQEALGQTRQFEAYSKLTAFLMHDLKNMISQQELVVGNARRFRDRPDFIDDAIGTMDSSVRRMRRLLERFRSMASAAQASRIDVATLIMQVCSDCEDREPAPTCAPTSGLYVSMDRDKLAMALTHAIRNSQDATPHEGVIRVSATTDGDRVFIEVQDSGSGMDEAFIRNKLFRPFVSTKGARGMGIGAYQMRETARTAGGDVEVVSVVGQGTIMRFVLPADLSASKLTTQSVA